MAEDPDIAELLPEDAEADDEELLELIDAGLDEDDLEGDYDVVDTEPAPIGRTWNFDFSAGMFVMEGRSPQTLRGDAALLAWIEKCLMTTRGSSVVQHPEYGLETPIGDYLGGDPEETFELESDIEAAVTFHPAISSVEDMNVELGTTPEGDMAAEISFRVILGSGGEIPIEFGVTDNG